MKWWWQRRLKIQCIYEHTHIKKPGNLARWFVKNGYLLIEDKFGGTGNIALLIS